MDKEELLARFGLNIAPKPVEKPPIQFEGPFDAMTAQVSDEDYSNPTCLNLNKWDIAKGAECRQRLNLIQLTNDEIADLRGAAFLLEPELNPGCIDKRRFQFLKTLMETAEYNALHTQTQLDDLASEAAVKSFAAQYLKLKEEDEQRKQERNQRKEEMRLLRCVNKALQKAAEEVDELEEMRYAIGCGSEDPSWQQIDTSRIANAFHQCKNNPRIRRIIELAGRFRLLAQSKQRQKTIHGRDDVVGVELSGDIERLVPTELGLLADPDFELDAMRRLVEKQSMSKKYQGKESKQKGPIVVFVDESYSMEGEKVCNAKAFALAMAWVARHQRRYCCLCSFSSMQSDVNPSQYVITKPGQPNEERMVTWLGGFMAGGTHLSVPLDIIPQRKWAEIGAPKGKTDIIIITDGEVGIPKDLRSSFLEWKVKEQARVISLILDSSPSQMPLISDEVHMIHSIDVQSDAISRCLSI